MATIIPLHPARPPEPGRLSAEGIYAELSLLARRTRNLLNDLPPFDPDCPLGGTVREVDRAWRALTLAQELTPPPDPATSVPPAILQVDELTVCIRTRTATMNEQRLGLTRYEFDLLAVLARDPVAVRSKDFLLREVWGMRYPVRTRTVDTHASRLRRKLATACPRAWIVNHWGIGYSLTHPGTPEVVS